MNMMTSADIHAEALTGYRLSEWLDTNYELSLQHSHCGRGCKYVLLNCDSEQGKCE